MTQLTVLLIFHTQACPAEGTHQTVDEGLFHVLHGASLCLDSMKSMLCSPVLVTHEEEPQLRLLHLQVRRLTAKKHLTSDVYGCFQFQNCHHQHSCIYGWKIWGVIVTLMSPLHFLKHQCEACCYFPWAISVDTDITLKGKCHDVFFLSLTFCATISAFNFTLQFLWLSVLNSDILSTLLGKNYKWNINNASYC